MKSRKLTRGCLLQFSLAIALIGLSAQVRAQAPALGNAGFELPRTGNFTYNPPVAPNQPWTFTGNCGVAIPFSFGRNGNSTDQYAFLQRGAPSSISQTVTFVSAGTYRFSYYEAGRSSSSGDLTYSVTFTPAGAGAAVFTANRTSISNQPFVPIVFSVTIPAAGDYSLVFATVSGTTGDDTALFDNVSITIPVVPSVGDPGFELPYLPNEPRFQYGPPTDGVGQPWTFGGPSGVALSRTNALQ